MLKLRGKNDDLRRALRLRRTEVEVGVNLNKILFSEEDRLENKILSRSLQRRV